IAATAGHRIKAELLLRQAERSAELIVVAANGGRALFCHQLIEHPRFPPFHPPDVLTNILPMSSLISTLSSVIGGTLFSIVQALPQSGSIVEHYSGELSDGASDWFASGRIVA